LSLNLKGFIRFYLSLSLLKALEVKCNNFYLTGIKGIKADNGKSKKKFL